MSFKGLPKAELTHVPEGRWLIAAPNPASDEVQVWFRTPEGGSAKLALFSVNGERVLARHFSELRSGENSVTLSLNGVASGLYYLALFTDNGMGVAHRDIFKLAVVK